VYEVEVTNTTITKKTYYYPAGGAVRVEDFNNSANSGVFYILKDHLGSASVTLDSNGTAISESRYYPFGETRVTSGTIPTDKRFQSQRDVGLGLMHFGARFYHPRLGRFISADTIVPNFANPQSLNRYAFVLNNPLKYIDPTGHTSACANAAIADPECSSPSNDPVIYQDAYSGGGLEPEEVVFQNSSNGGTSVGGGDFCSQNPVACQFESKVGGGGCLFDCCVLDCTFVQIESMSWQERANWLGDFNGETRLGNFYNVQGILKYFNGDPVFSSSKWASVSDAAVLFVIMNGYRLKRGWTSLCSSAPDSSACEDASSLWSSYFENMETKSSDTYAAWGVAEQGGVNYGTSVAIPYLAPIGSFENSYANTFVMWGNAYRSLVADYNDVTLKDPWFIPILNPDWSTSGAFVYWYSTNVISLTAGVYHFVAYP
jgi:RHS repeat-associated protein